MRRGIMTGEGPTTQGRAHFSRTLDAEDAALIAQILSAAGGEAGKPVTRAEVEILLDIHQMALERADEGRFDELFVKAISHHVLSVAGRSVPLGQSMALTWSSTNANSCTASASPSQNDWSGPEPTSGSRSVRRIAARHSHSHLHSPVRRDWRQRQWRCVR